MGLFEEHSKKKDKCPSLERKPSSDWVTCTHADNPTAIKVCSYEHCPVVNSDADSSRTLKRKAVAGALWYACRGMLLCLFVAILSFTIAYFQIVV